jgi:hypothetical protein
MTNVQRWFKGRKHVTLSAEHWASCVDKIFAMRNLLVPLAVFLTAQSVYAQGAYVSASLTGDLVRQNRVKNAVSDQSTDGEAIGFALRIGSEIGRRWGVELEYARPQEIENDFAPGIVPLPAATVVPGVIGGFPTDAAQIFPTFSYRIRTSQRNTMISSAVWARQEISPRMSLVYLGGVGFHRTTSEATLTFEPGVPRLGLPIAIPPSVTNSTTYDVGPFAGMEARIGLTAHAQLVPGIRLHGINGGWLFRPSVGLGWMF